MSSHQVKKPQPKWVKTAFAKSPVISDYQPKWWEEHRGPPRCVLVLDFRYQDFFFSEFYPGNPWNNYTYQNPLGVVTFNFIITHGPPASWQKIKLIEARQTSSLQESDVHYTRSTRQEKDDTIYDEAKEDQYKSIVKGRHNEITLLLTHWWWSWRIHDREVMTNRVGELVEHHSIHDRFQSVMVSRFDRGCWSTLLTLIQIKIDFISCWPRCVSCCAPSLSKYNLLILFLHPLFCLIYHWEYMIHPPFPPANSPLSSKRAPETKLVAAR